MGDAGERGSIRADEVEIRQGLPETLREAGAALFDDAFGDKIRFAIPDRLARRTFIARAFSAERVIVATQGPVLLGLMGLSSGSGRFRGGIMAVSWDPRPYRELLGWRGALRAVAGLRLADHRPASDELLIDGIAVVPHARGLGIGSRLLGRAEAIAREEGKRWLRLDVISANPRAQSLYERLGSRVTRVQSTLWMSRWLGYDAIISMERDVAAPASATPAPGS